MPYPLVNIIILNWNNPSDTIKCLESLQDISYPNYNIILIDNNSKDDSVKKIKQWANDKRKKILMKPVKELDSITENEKKQNKLFLILNDVNNGFAGGNNTGCKLALELSSPSYLLLLNNDTLVAKDFLNKTVEVLEKDKKIGSAQSVLLRFDKKIVDSLGLEMRGHRIFDSASGENKSVLKTLNEIEEIFGACGAAAFYRAEIIKKIGLFDEGLFATFEDFDLAWRIRLAGFKTVLVRDSVVFHRGGMSRSSKGHVMFDLRSYYAARNVLVVYARYYPIKTGALLNSIVWFGVGIISTVKNKKYKDFLSILANFAEERKRNKNNGLLKEVQKTWIK
jgi:GT2 family glycosyltransferase